MPKTILTVLFPTGEHPTVYKVEKLLSKWNYKWSPVQDLIYTGSGNAQVIYSRK